jgi:hypothetical protein
LFDIRLMLQSLEKWRGAMRPFFIVQMVVRLLLILHSEL